MQGVNIWKEEKPEPHFDKLAIGFLADVLYAKEIINSEELNDIYDVVHPGDLDVIVQKMVRGDYDERLKRGESYTLYRS